MTTTLVIAQCTDEKRDGKHPAQELYMPSRLFRAQRKYAETFGDEWLILSAKYGLVTPETEILSYDETFDQTYVPEVRQETKDELFRSLSKQGTLARINAQVDDMDIDAEQWRVVLLCGEKYCKRVEWYLDEYKIQYEKPFDGLRIGERIKAMQRAVAEELNNDITAYA